MSDDKGYAPPEPSGSPWPCPLSSPDPVTAADGTITCTVQNTHTEVAETGMPSVAPSLTLALAMLAAAAAAFILDHRLNRSPK